MNAKKKMNGHLLHRGIVLLAWFLAGICANSVGAEEDITAMQMRLRSLQSRQAQGRYVDQTELNQLQSDLDRRVGTIQQTRMRAEALENEQLSDRELDALRNQALKFIANTTHGYVRDHVRGRETALREEIQRASSARDVARFVETHTYGIDAPQDNPALSEFYNGVYQEQGWLARSLDARIKDRQQKLDRLSTFNTIDQGIEAAGNMRREAEKKVAEYREQLNQWAQEGLGVDDQQFASLQKKLGAYSSYARQARDAYQFVTDLRNRAVEAGDSIPDLPEAARQGLRGMVYIGEGLKQVGERLNVRGVRELMDFYGDATRVSLVAAENAQEFKLGHGEIDRVNQVLGVYNPALEKLGLNQATISEFSKATGVRVIRGQDGDGQGYYILNDKYEPLNTQPLSGDDYAALKQIYGNFDAIRRDSENPLTPEELQRAMEQYKAGEPVVIRGEDYGEKGRYLDLWARLDAEGRARTEISRDVYERVHDMIPERWGEWFFGRDEQEYIRQIDRLIGELSEHDISKWSEIQEQLESALMEGLLKGETFADILEEFEEQFTQETEEDLQVRFYAEPREVGPGDEVRIWAEATGGQGDFTYYFFVEHSLKPSGVPTGGTSENSFSFTVGRQHGTTDGFEQGTRSFVVNVWVTSPTTRSSEASVVRHIPGSGGPVKGVQLVHRMGSIRFLSRSAWEARGGAVSRTSLRDAEATTSPGSGVTAEAGASALEIFGDGREADRQRQREQAAMTAQQQLDMTRGARAGDQQARVSRQTRDSAGRDAQQTRDAAARDAARTQRDQSWGTALGDAVADGVQTGMETLAETIGRGAADQVSRDIFGPTREEREAAREPDPPAPAVPPKQVATADPVAPSSPQPAPTGKAPPAAEPPTEPTEEPTEPAPEKPAPSLDCSLCDATSAEQVTLGDGSQRAMCSTCKNNLTCSECNQTNLSIGGASYTAYDETGAVVWRGSIEAACQPCSDAWYRAQQAKWEN